MSDISFGTIKVREHLGCGCSLIFLCLKLVQHSDIVNGDGIWYGNGTIFDEIKVYFIPYIVCSAVFCVRVCGGSPDIPTGKDEKIGMKVRTD